MWVRDPAWKQWYRAMHDQRCLASGEAFEKYVESVLTRHHSDYFNPDPMGRHGDGGCDGVAESGTILYACYGQRALADADRKLKKKFESDFARALGQWEFKKWRFVTNAQFGPLPTKRLVELQREHSKDSDRPIEIDVWNTDKLWSDAVSLLSERHLDEIIPGVPHAQDAQLEDMVELIQALESGDTESSDVTVAIRPVPASKMDFNKLPETTRAEFNTGRVHAPRIQEWFSRQYDPELRDRKAQRFREIYQQARAATTDVREIVRSIYGAIGGPDFDLSTKRANAVYAVTVFFFDSCDIFEEPPANYNGEESDNASSY